MRVKLKNLLFYGGRRYRAGEIVDLPPAAVPKSAVVVSEVTEEAPAEVEKPPKLVSRYVPSRRPDGGKWRVLYGDTVVEEFRDKSQAEQLRVDLEQNPDILDERLAELRAEGEGGADAVP